MSKQISTKTTIRNLTAEIKKTFSLRRTPLPLCRPQPTLLSSLLALTATP